MTVRAPRILVVDDEPAVLATYRAILRSPATTGGDADEFRPELTLASQGQQAIDAVASATASGGYAVAFVDMHMPPGIDGFATVERLWTIDADLQVVIVSGFADLPVADLAERFGATDKLLVLKKPFEAVEVRQLAAALCRKRELLREARQRERRLELHVAERTRELAAALQAAKSAARTRLQFLANMSHEIRTPLTAILGYAELLRDPACSEDDRQQHVQVLERNSHHLLQLVNDVLDLSKLEARQLLVDASPTDVPALLAEVVSMMRPAAAEKGLPLELRFVTPCPRTMLTDGMRVRQILLNLLGNAIKFTATGSVSLQVESVDAATGPCLAFHVVDTGIGIPTERQSALFEPFVQADASTSRRFGGTGLGLSISRQLAKCLGGDVVLRSAPGEGSTFSLLVPSGDLAIGPWLATPGEAAPPVAPTANAQPRGRLAGRILLVEDGADNRRLLTTILRKAGADVATATNGVEAIDAALSADAAGAPFGLVLMDMQMPVMDGYTATRALRRSGWQRPIVALTAHAMEGDRERCLAEGCDGYETKPVRAERLVATCARFLEPAAEPSSSSTSPSSTSPSTTSPR